MKLLLPIFVAVLTFSSYAQNINITNTQVFDGEPYLAVDPTNPQHLVAAWMGFKLGQSIIIKSSYSTNGGITWSTPNEIAHQTTGNTSADVALKYDGQGSIYMSYVDYDGNNFINGAILVRKSIDNGITWGAAVEAINISDCPGKLCVDRPWMAVDNSGGPNDGTVYITSMNADQPTLISPPYNPYLAVSTDGGTSFSTPRFLDTTNYLAGSVITQPMPSPTVDANGTFYAAYPSYETSQSPFAHSYLAASTNAGTTITHTNANTLLMPTVTDPLAKKAGLLFSDPSAPNHLAMIFLGKENGDGDVYFLETFDATSWSNPVRVNQDPIGNGKLQDLIWGSFNENGDLAICWRDRRNGANGYQTDTEIYGVIRYKDSTQFEQDFAISSQQVPHAAVLDGSGNDFMNVQFVGDTLYAIWGDVRTGTVNIFLNKTHVGNGTVSIHSVYSETPAVQFFPNPAKDQITISNFNDFEEMDIIDGNGKHVFDIAEPIVNISPLTPGRYFIHGTVNGKGFLSPLIIQ